MSVDEHAVLKAALTVRLASVDKTQAWDELGRAGMHGILIPEQFGGAGIPVADAALLMEVVGGLGLATTFLETSIVAPGLLAAAGGEHAEALLRAIARDGARIAVAGLDPRLRGDVRARRTDGGWRLQGAMPVVTGVIDAASIITIAPADGGLAVFLLPADPIFARHHFPTIDGRDAADLFFDDVEASLLLADAAPIVEQQTDIALACLAIEGAALMARLVRDTADFVRQREQFGQPLSRFQVLQHRLVDMQIQVRRATAIARRAIDSLDAADSVRARAVSASKVTIARAGRYVGQQAVQLHGGMGMTEDLPIGTLFKRLTVIENELCSVDDALRRFGAATSG